MKQINAAPPRLSAELLATDIGRAMDAIIQACLVKDPAERALSAAQLAEMFGRLAAGRPGRRRRALRVGGGGVRARPRAALMTSRPCSLAGRRSSSHPDALGAGPSRAPPAPAGRRRRAQAAPPRPARSSKSRAAASPRRSDDRRSDTAAPAPERGGAHAAHASARRRRWTLTDDGASLRSVVLVAVRAAPAWASPAAARAGARRPGPGRALFEQAEAKFNLGRFDEALTDYQAAYEVEPLPAFLFNIGQCYRNMGNYERAQFFFRRYTALDPRSPNRPAAERLIAEMDRMAEENRAAAGLPTAAVGAVAGCSGGGRRGR